MWPESGLDAAALRRAEWTPLPFTEFVVKIHSRCNLACDYCYIYEMADQGWRNQPKVMRRETFTTACAMIGEHALRHKIDAVQLVFHGGEPLLAGHAELAFFARHARETLGKHLGVQLSMQTNGVLLDDEFLRLCAQWNIGIGVSLDGDATANDRHRRDRRGRGSHADVAAALARLSAPEYRHLYGGLLCTIDVANDPIRTYEGLLRFRPPSVDFLLPHGNWTNPPPHRVADSTETPYADWLIPIFDRWYGERAATTSVRLFEDIVDLLIGGTAGSELIGLEPIQLAVIETDGTLEQVDELKSAYAGAAGFGLRGLGNALDEAMRLPAVIARQIGVEALSDECRACPIHTVCGGGHYVHRYRADSGFRHPSVYCADLTKLIRHIDSRVGTDLARSRQTGEGS
ncbi:FxsB family radical SAM/SPASM domain protein [Nocardia panacis]|uniref:FxsB family radical SAM/SPASM domain protein n=2 Tax=Nocardia panacis TaxID=2340916 RepID=A0A3A4KQ80_9NOCA|nr:FxsB family radical SAM/SPASM domain protein [Nocardia panacis]